MAFGTQKFKEIRFHGLSVQISFEIKEINLAVGADRVLYGGADSDVGNAEVRSRFGMHLNRVNAEFGNQSVGGEALICRWESERSAELLSVNDLCGNGVRSGQHTVCACGVPDGKRLSDLGGADGVPVKSVRGDDLDRAAQRREGILQRLRVSFCGFSVAEIKAAKRTGDLTLSEQDVLGELLVRKRADILEVGKDQKIDSEIAEKRIALLGGCQKRSSVFKTGGWYGKSKYRAFGDIAAFLRGERKQLLVPRVNAVEIADGAGQLVFLAKSVFFLRL